MFDLSPLQIGIVLVIALLALGPRRLPELARALGRALTEFRGAMSLDQSQPGPAQDAQGSPDGDAGTPRAARTDAPAPAGSRQREAA